MATVRAHKSPAPLQSFTGLTKERQFQIQSENLRRSLWYARENLGLRA